MADFQLKRLVRASRPPAASSTVIQRSVTLTFSGVAEFVVNFRGETFIKGPVTLTGYTPSAYGSGVNARNGAMINPPTRLKNGYDGRVFGVSGVDYADVDNMGLGLPRVLNPGDTLIIATSANPTLNIDSWNNFNCISTYEMFTIVDTLPPVNAFRPPFCAGPKPIFTTDDVNVSLLGGVTSAVNPFTTTPGIWSSTSPKMTLSQTIIDQSALAGGITAALAASSQNEWYPAYRYGNMTKLMAYSMCNLPNNLTYAYNIIQAAIDLRYQYLAGWRWANGAGFGGSRGCVILYGGKLLNNPDVSGTPWLTIGGDEQSVDPVEGWPLADNATLHIPEQCSHYYSPTPYSGYTFPPSYNPAGKGGFANAWPMYGDNGFAAGANHSSRDPAGKYVACGVTIRYPRTDAENTVMEVAGSYMQCCSNRFWMLGTLVCRMLGVHTNLNSPALLDFCDWWAYDDNLAIPSTETISDYNRDVWKFGGTGNLFCKNFWEANR